jgi:hypothetical protein
MIWRTLWFKPEFVAHPRGVLLHGVDIVAALERATLMTINLHIHQHRALSGVGTTLLHMHSRVGDAAFGGFRDVHTPVLRSIPHFKFMRFTERPSSCCFACSELQSSSINT